MSANEKLHMYADKLTNEQAHAAVAMIETYLQALDEALDDAFCAKLLDEAKNDSREEFDDFEEFAAKIEAGWV